MYFQAMNGFMMMMTQNGKLLYISENAAEYLGHSMVCINITTILTENFLIILKLYKLAHTFHHCKRDRW